MVSIKESEIQYPPLRLLSHEDLEHIFETAQRILWEVGMKIDHPRAREVLSGAGARIEKDRVYFPQDLIISTTKLIPKRYTYHGRTKEFDYTASIDGPLGGRPAGGCIGYKDLATGSYRRGGIADWREIVHLADALPNIRSVGNMHCGDVPMETSDVHSVKVVLESGRKCAVHGAATARNLMYQVELLLAVYGSKQALAERPQIHHMIATTSPLFLPNDHMEQLFIAVENGIPLDVAVMSIVGMSAPVTVAGALAQSLAEELGTIALIQSIKPGHPVAFFLDPVVGNMRNADVLCAAPESALIIAAACQLGTELLGLPTEAIGFDTDGFTLGQTMFQKAQNLIFQVMAGGKMIVGAGCTESIMTLDPVQLVIDNELITIAERLTRKIVVDEHSLALDAVKRVGPQGFYLIDEHTLDSLHEGELVDLPLSERESRRQTWVSAGSKTLESRAREKGLEIVKNYKVPELPADVLRELDRIVKKADETLAG
jgi:trimethylamine--corrinoid protein Co-methyltransferase